MSNTPNRLRRTIVTGAMVAGATLGAAGIASAATSTGSTASTTATAPSGAPTGAPPAGAAGKAPNGTRPSGGDPATMSHGPGETLLTGTQLQEATTAATAAVPGATVVRAETNSSGGYPYEVHLKKSDGSYATVELNSSFGVVTTVSGFGAGPAGGQPPAGAPSGTAASSGTTA